MRIGITGTPGVGKSTVARRLANRLGFSVTSLDDIVIRRGAYLEYDVERDSYVVDEEAVEKILNEVVLDNGVYEGLSVVYTTNPDLFDIVFVLRCDPYTLEERLRAKGFKEAKIKENVSAEILDIVYADALRIYGASKVKQVDNSRGLDETVDKMLAKLEDDRAVCDSVDWLTLVMEKGDVKRFLE